MRCGLLQQVRKRSGIKRYQHGFLFWRCSYPSERLTFLTPGLEPRIFRIQGPSCEVSCKDSSLYQRNFTKPARSMKGDRDMLVAFQEQNMSETALLSAQ